MQGAIARVCVVVAAAIFNHPLLFPQENNSLPEQDEELLARMRQHEERLRLEQAKLEKELSELESSQEEEEAHSWHLWSALTFIIFFTIEMCRLDFADVEMRLVDDEDLLSESGSISPHTVVLDKDALNNFCDRCTYNSAHEHWRVREFVEGFADDLLESLRSVGDRQADVEVGDFVGVGSTFESWNVCKPLMCDLIVPFSPPEPFSFQFRPWCDPSSDLPPDVHGCGSIQVTRRVEDGGGCLCGSVNLGEDMLCLLHTRHAALVSDRSLDELLCSKNTPYLSKDRVMKWFQISVTKAWGRIAHKYDFEVTFRSLDAAGALKIRFRSGKFIVMNLIPAVQLDNTDAYFVSHFPSDSSSSSPDPYWSLSLAVYERNLLKLLARHLPQSPCHLHCLRIVTFLHRKQVGLTGRNGLTNYHWKTVLLHLLLSTRPSLWGVESTERRLRDVLGFMRRSLQEKRLPHVLIGNRKVPDEVQVPEMVRKAEPVNLFRCLVLQRDLYAATERHFQEMLRNLTVLIQEYTPLAPPLADSLDLDDTY